SSQTHFYFQAEDGIRDRNVTGVQTCALPIYIPGLHFGQRARELQHQAEHHQAVGVGLLQGGLLEEAQPGEQQAEDQVADVRVERSEERRVGKGCCAWWGPW